MSKAEKRAHFQDLSTQARDRIAIGDLGRAEALLEEALALKPSSAKTANDLGVVLLQLSADAASGKSLAEQEAVEQRLLRAQHVLRTALETKAGKKPAVARTLNNNLLSVAQELATTSSQLSRVRRLQDERPPPLPRISAAQLLDRGGAYFDGHVPFVLVPDNFTAPLVVVAEATLGLDMLSREYPDSIVDVYPDNMDHTSKKPHLSHLRHAAEAFRSAAANPAGGRIPYLQWRAPLTEWIELERDHFGRLVPDWFRTDAAWFAACLGPDVGTANGSFAPPTPPDVNIPGATTTTPTDAAAAALVDHLAVVGNFMASQHWSVVSIGMNGSGMFFHADGIATSTYHLQLRGRKRWFVCPPQRHGAGDNGHGPSVDFLQFSAGDVDAFSPATWLPRFPDFAASATACTETTVRPGELLYYPTGWWHQTLNLDAETVGLAARRVDRHNFKDVFASVARKCAEPCVDITADFPGAAPCLAAEVCARWTTRCLPHMRDRLFADAAGTRTAPSVVVGAEAGAQEARVIREDVPRYRPGGASHPAAVAAATAAAAAAGGSGAREL